MRYAIEHRRPARDSTGPHVIRCLVWLSRDERLWLRARGATDGSFDPPSAPFMAVLPEAVNMKWVRGFGRTMIAVGVALLFVPALAYLGLALLCLGILIEIYGWLDLAMRYRRFAQPDLATAIRQILNHPRFSLRADTAGEANALELETGDAVGGLKALLAARPDQAEAKVR